MLYVRLTVPGVHHLAFEHVRPWSRATVARIKIDIDGHGRDREGWATATDYPSPPGPESPDPASIH